MAQTQVEIQVELNGARKVEKGIKKIEGGLDGVGETGSRLAKTMGTTNKKLGEGLENIGGAVGEVKESFKSLGAGVSNLGKTGAKGFLSLLGPIGKVASAGLLVYETFRMITGAAQEAEEAEEAMNAASADLQSKLESLAEKGVIPTTKELLNFSMAVIESQLAKETFEKALTKYRKTFEKITLAKKQAAEATKEMAREEENGTYTYIQAVLKRKAANELLQKSREEAKKGVIELQEVQRETLKEIKLASEQEQELDKRSTDSLKTEAKKLANLQKERELLKARNQAKGDELFLADAEATQKIKLLRLEEELEDATHEQTQAILKRIKANGRIKAEEVELLRLKQRQIEISQKEAEEAKKVQEQRRKLDEARRKQEEQEKKKDLVLTSQINQVEIKLLFEKNEQALELEKERHRVTKLLTKEGSKERELEEKRHQLAIRNIKDGRLKEEERQENQRLQQLQEANEKELNLRYDLARRMTEIEQQPLGFGTEIERLTFESEQRLNILELEFQREINLARMRGEEITGIQRKYAIERRAITQENLNAEIEVLGAYFDQYAAGFAAAGYNALFFGDSFKQATSQILRGLGEQAAVQALMETATAFSHLASGLIPNFAASIKSAGMYAAAAIAAGVASNALGGGGGGGVAAPATSPTGQPTTAPTPEREDVTTQGMVFNINFGGAVVYDTKKAAEQAFADRLVSIINTPRRGAVQFNRR